MNKKMAADDASDFKSDKYTIHRTLVSIAVLLAWMLFQRARCHPADDDHLVRCLRAVLS